MTRSGTGPGVRTSSVTPGRHPATASQVSSQHCLNKPQDLEVRHSHYLVLRYNYKRDPNVVFDPQVPPSACARQAGPGGLRRSVVSSAPGPGVTRDRYYRSTQITDTTTIILLLMQETSGCNCVPYEQCPTFLKVHIMYIYIGHEYVSVTS